MTLSLARNVYDLVTDSCRAARARKCSRRDYHLFQ